MNSVPSLRLLLMNQFLDSASENAGIAAHYSRFALHGRLVLIHAARAMKESRRVLQAAEVVEALNGPLALTASSVKRRALEILQDAEQSLAIRDEFLSRIADRTVVPVVEGRTGFSGFLLSLIF